ncbi:MAG: hypothetical protein CL470_05020 [Acidimicrobiaceae bacterium]|nr:hypothetical protein [Acidimicrobiaceae bacterium]
MSEQGLVLYDGGCGLCNRIVGFVQPRLRSRDSLNFLPLESHEGTALVKDLAPEFQQIDSLIFIEEHKVYAYSSAVLRCLVRMKWQYAVWSPLLWVIPLPIRNWIYQRIAKSRHRFFVGTSSCTLENTEKIQI